MPPKAAWTHSYGSIPHEVLREQSNIAVCYSYKQITDQVALDDVCCSEFPAEGAIIHLLDVESRRNRALAQGLRPDGLLCRSVLHLALLVVKHKIDWLDAYTL